MTDSEPKMIAELRAELHECSRHYYLWSTSNISDEDYDRKLVQLRELEARHPDLADPNSPTQRVGEAEVSSFEKVKHHTPMLSLEKATTVAELMGFFRPWLKYGENDAVKGTIEPKVDGVSLSLIYEKGSLVRAVTRGNGSVGDNVTSNARTIRTVPVVLAEPVSIEVRGEVFLRLSDFQRVNEEKIANGNDPAANARNSASGALRLLNPKETAKNSLSFVAYASPTEIADILTHDALLEYLETLGFMSPFSLPPPIKSCLSMTQVVDNLRDSASLEKLLKELDESRKLQDFLADGLVIKVNDLAVQRELGLSNNSPRWAIAYKFPPERVTAKIKQIKIQIGRTGKATPVAEFEPVAIGGTITTAATLNNQEMIAKRNIGIGDEVILERSGDVIPNVVALAKAATDRNGSFVFPKVCPFCSQPLIKQEKFVDMYCTNSQCPERLKSALAYATGKECLDIDGCGKATVKELIDHGVLNLLDFFRLKDFSFLKPAARKKLKEGREKAKQADLWRKLCALSIERLGKTKCQELAARWSSLADIIEHEQEMRTVLGQVDYEAFCAYVIRNEDYIADLEAAGFILADEGRTEGPLTGKSFVITGQLSRKRDEVEAMIMKVGGIVKSSVTKNVKFLVVGTEPGGNKLAGAKRHGTTVLSEEELFKMMGANIPVFVPVIDKPEPEY